jgi:hypothetical protein
LFNGPHFGIVTAIKSKEKPILHHDIDKRFGLRGVLGGRGVASLLGAILKDAMSNRGAVSQNKHDALPAGETLLGDDCAPALYR